MKLSNLEEQVNDCHRRDLVRQQGSTREKEVYNEVT